MVFCPTYKMNRIILIAILFLAFGNFSSAQEVSMVDSLKKVLNNSIDDTTKVNTLNAIAEENVYIDHEKIYDYAQQALEISEDIGYKKGIAQSFNNLGTYYRTKGIYDESIDYYFSALEIMEELDDINGIARCYNLIGILYYYLGNYHLSLEYYMMALDINQQQNDKKWIAGNSNNIGMIYQRQEQYEKALEFYMKSLEMNTELGFKNWIANNYGNIGSLYQLMNNPESLNWFKKRLWLNEEQKDTAGIAQSYFLIGNYYVAEGRFEDAILYLQKSYNLAFISGSLTALSSSTEKLSASHAQLKNFSDALMFEKQNKIYDDSLQLFSNTEKITRLQMQYQHKNDQQINKLRYERSKIIQVMFAAGLFLILIFIVAIYSWQRIKSRHNKLEESKLMLGNKLLHEELEFKEKMLQDNIKYLLSINELLTETIGKFNIIKSDSKPENQHIIKDIISHLQSGMNDDIWEEFELRFNQIHKDFYKTLNTQFPELSANDKKLCAFLKLNMNTKEISSITSLSIKSIETARSRLRKKLNIQDKSIGLSEFLNDI